MFQGLQEDKLKGAVEAMLFVTDEPVGAVTLAQMLECEVSLVQEALFELRDAFEREDRGIQLREVAGGWRLFTHPVYHELIEKYVLSWDTRKLSNAAMETLAIIAYTQPVTRAGVASVRGVNSDSSISSLVEKGLVREAGVADTPGSPTLYATTHGFLEKFGLRSVADLPDLADFAPDDETRRLITERLSATRKDAEVSEEHARLMAAAMMDAELEGEARQVLDGEASARPLFGGEEDVEAEAGEGAAAPTTGAAKTTEAMFAEAIASTLGVVDKIDFDALVFETDDE